TPKILVEAILKQVIDYFPENFKSRPRSILDPAIGKGVFFLSLIPIISSFITEAKLYGIDIDSSLIKIAQKNLHNIIERNSYEIKLKRADFFQKFPEDLPRKFDVIIGNPPHNALYSEHEWRQIRKLSEFSSYNRIYSESSVFFTFKSLPLLKTGGILCFLLPKPIIYSKRWSEFRKILLTQYNLIEILDLGNQFSGQLQEQCAIIVKREKVKTKNQEYKTGIWNSTENEFGQISSISKVDALKADNFLVGVSYPELKIIRRLYSNEYEFLKVYAFRGLSSKYRVKKGAVPLIEKSTISSGFLYPVRSFLNEDTPIEKLKRLQTPKIIAQRIISYKTKPKFKLKIRTLVDQEGVFITHETVINIVPNYSQENLSLSAVAGLLESSLIAWWLQHAVYTKEFVTSKDFDKAYINSIRIPRIRGSKSIDYRKKFVKLLENNNFDEIMIKVRNQSIIDQLHSLGEIYLKYQDVGGKIKVLLHKMMNENVMTEFSNMKPNFWNLKRLYQHLTLVHLNSKTSPVQDAHYTEFMIRFSEFKTLNTFMNNLVSLIYKLTPFEEKIINQNEKN
ncbi:MAG: Eco57I restriction-modification methylase domain-containing protein, partial [Promethearchaeota archaeon]